MKCFFALALSALLVAVVFSENKAQPQPIRFQPGKTYEYLYKGRLLTGIPGLDKQHAGLQVVADLVLQAPDDRYVAMKLSNIRVGVHNGKGPYHYQDQLPMDYQQNSELERHLTKPIRFEHVDGKVKTFEADQSEPEWSLNYKKGILSLLNVNLSPKKIIKSRDEAHQLNLVPQPESDLTYYPIYEDGIGGLCETVYEINAMPDETVEDIEQVLNITKTRNYDNCLTEPIIANDNFDVRGCPWVCRKEKSFSAVPGYYPTPDEVENPYVAGCPCGKNPHDSPVDAYNHINYNISQRQEGSVIEGVYSEGKVIYNTFGDQILVITQQNMTLVHYGSIRDQIETIPQAQRHNELSFRLPTVELTSGQKQPLDIPYYHLFEPKEPVELIRLVKELLHSFAEEVETGEVSVTKDSMPKTVQIVNALAVLSKEDLRTVYREVAQEKYPKSTKEQIIRKLFLDSVPLTGTNDAALFIKHLIEQNEVTLFEAKELVEAVPQNLFIPDVTTIDAYLELFQQPKIQQHRTLAASTGIAFGKMVKEGCLKRQHTPGDVPDENDLPANQRNRQAEEIIQLVKPSKLSIQPNLPSSISGFSNRMKRSAPWEETFTQQICKESDVQKYVQIVGRLLEQAKHFHEKVTLIETLAHMGVPQTLQVLYPYVTGRLSLEKLPLERNEQPEEELQFIRQVAIYALSHVAEYYPKQVLPVVLPIYSNQSEPHQIRIAAFTTLIFADPEQHVLTRIASQLEADNNKQVKSFVHSTLQQIGNFSLPCFEKMASAAEKAYVHVPQDVHGFQYSKMFGQDYYDKKRDFGLYTVTEFVANNKSRIPRSGYFAVGQSNGPFQDELLQVGFNAKGIDNLIHELFEQNGMISQMIQKIQPQKQQNKQQQQIIQQQLQQQQAMEELKQKLDLEYRSEEEPKATVFFKLFDRTSYYPIDKEYIHQLIKDAEKSLKEVTKSLLRGGEYHYIKLLMPSQLYKVVPSEMSFPVVVSHRHPMVISVKISDVKAKMEASQNSIYPLGVNVSATVQPSLFYSSYSFVFAVNPADHQAYGTHVEKTTQVTLPVEVSVGYVAPNNLLTWSVVPKHLPKQVVYHKTQAKTFVSKARIAVEPNRDWLSHSEEIHKLPEPFQVEKRVGHEWLGLGAKIQVESEDVWYDSPVWVSPTAKLQGFIPALVENFRNPGLEPREVNITVEVDSHLPTHGFSGTLQYKTVENYEQGSDVDDSDESSQSNESDSDESDESSASKSSQSLSSEESKKLVKKSQNKQQKLFLSKQKRSIPESNESSHESSNSSGDLSSSKSGSKQSSQESVSRKSSESSDSSSESDESVSIEDQIFNYPKMMKTIKGQDFQKKSIVKKAKEMMERSRPIWQQQQQQQKQPQTVAHDLSLTAVARGPQPRFYAVDLLYVHTLDHKTVWVKTEAHIKAPQVQNYSPKVFCADAVVAYPNAPNDFYFEKNQMLGQKALIKAHAGWGQDKCYQESEQQQIVINGVMERTRDQVIEPKQKKMESQQFQEWFMKQCQIDKAQGKSQSTACQRAIVEESYLNQIVLDVKHRNVPKKIVNITQKIDLALKVLFYDRLDNNKVNVNNQKDHIKIVAQYSSFIPKIPLVNVRIEKPEENTQFNKIFVPFLRPFSTLLRTKNVYKNLLTNYEAKTQCNLMEDYIQTFDNVTIKLPKNQCQYLVAADCSQKERFAVIQSQKNQKTKIITVIVAGTKIQLEPPTQSRSAKVVVNGQQKQVMVEQPIIIKAPKDQIIVSLKQSIQSSSSQIPIIIVEAKQQQLKVLYDGKNAKMIVGGKYQGKTCGMCGDNNNESEKELQGPDMCIHQLPEDFINSYAFSGPQCQSVPKPKGQKICPQQSQGSFEDSNIFSRAKIQRQSLFESDSQQQEVQKMKTIHIQRGEMTCFTTKPVMTCLQGASSTKKVQLDFHCLPKDSGITQQLIKEAEKQVLKQLANKRVDIRQMVTVPVSCIA